VYFQRFAFEHAACSGVSPVSGSGSTLDEIFAKPPMTMKAGTIEVEIPTECGQRFTIGQEEPHRADVAVVSAPLNQRHAIDAYSRGFATGDVFEDEVGATVGDPVKFPGLVWSPDCMHQTVPSTRVPGGMPSNNSGSFGPMSPLPSSPAKR
jgi:hypothetical protein